MWFLRFNKFWISELSYHLSRCELLLLEQFLFYFNIRIIRFYIFIWLPNLILIIIFIIMTISTVTVVVITFVIIIIISSFSMLLTFISPVFNILFYTFVYIEYLIILNIWHDRTLLKVGNKDTEIISVSLLWNLNNVSLIYSSDDLLLKWHYYILLLTIISFIL